MAKTVKILGMNRLIKNLKQYVNSKEPELLGVVAHSSANIRFDAKHIVPVDTGYLRENINYEIMQRKNRIIGETAANTDYAIYVEFGTSKMRAQPFMEPAFRQEVPKFISAVEKVMQYP